MPAGDPAIPAPPGRTHPGRLRVLFVAGTLGRGGAERQLYYALRTLREHGVEAAVATLTRGEHWEPLIEELGVPVRWFGRSPNPIRRVAALVRIVGALRPTVLESAHFHTNLYTVAAARITGVQEIGAIRGDTNWSVRSLGHYGSLSLRMPRQMAANSLAALQQASDLGVASSRLTYLPNVVDTGHFLPAARPEGPVSLLSVGRLVEVKRHDRFLRLLRTTIDALPGVDVRGSIVGEGPLHDDIVGLARDLGVADRLTLQSDAEMRRVYQEATAFVLTSDAEGTPNVILEAMAMELPVVAFSVGGVPEVLTSPEFGIVIEPGDEEAMADAVVALMRDPEHRERVGAAARRHVVTERSSGVLWRYLDSLYRRAAGQGRRWRRRALPGRGAKATPGHDRTGGPLRPGPTLAL